MSTKEFRALIYGFYRSNKRILPWRETDDPYRILVSEIMLQQTQVSRVIPKFTQWMDVHTDVHTLAHATQHEVLSLWQGLGYNRRGLNLHRAAQEIIERFDGAIPRDERDLLSLPGVGPYTASAVLAFAYNEPVVMIETNIRTVFLHHYFNNKEDVSDREVLPLVEETLDKENPREWYWALMDYGSHLKKTVGNANVKSRHYSRQTRFEGSKRELRSKILKHVLKEKTVEKQKMKDLFPAGEWDANEIINELIKEGFLLERGTVVTVQ